MDKILIVVDYQNDFVDGALGFDGAAALDSGIAARVRSYGRGRVFFTRDTHSADYLATREGKNLPVAHCIEGTRGWEIFGETAAALEEVGAVGFNKRSFGLDITPEIAAKLPESVGEIELCGLVSGICVISNAVIFQTRYPEATVTVDARLTAAPDPILHEKTLDVLEGLQVKILNRQRVIPNV